MFYDKTTDRQAKYALRKKKNGGGAASFLIGTVVLGGLMIGGANTAHADTADATSSDAVKTTNQGTDRDAPSTILRSSATDKSNNVETTGSAQPKDTGQSVANNKVKPVSAETSEATNTPLTTPTESKLSAAPTSTQVTGQNTNSKVTITNIAFNKDVIRESEGTDLTITFNWEATGLHKGDTMEIPMFEGFDSIYKHVPPYTISSDTLDNMGTLSLDYDAHKIYAKFTGDVDPNTLYKGKMTIGTYVSREYFKNLQNKVDVKIPLPDGEPYEKQLTVIFDDAKSRDYDKSYLRAVDETLSDDETQGKVKWAVLVNRGQNEMEQPTIYIPTNLLNYWGDGVDPSTLAFGSLDHLDSIHVYEAQISPFFILSIRAVVHRLRSS